jgi:hypothetical protein
VQRPTDLEHSILSDFVPGREMPFPPASVSSFREQALSFDERERIRLWIAQGANLEECGGCTSVAFLPDAGAPDVGPITPPDSGTETDAGADADAATDAADQ